MKRKLCLAALFVAGSLLNAGTAIVTEAELTAATTSTEYLALVNGHIAEAGAGGTVEFQATSDHTISLSGRINLDTNQANMIFTSTGDGEITFSGGTSRYFFLYTNGSTVTFENLTFADATAAVVFAQENTTVNADQCSFRNNNQNGTGGSVFGTEKAGGSYSITNCTFEGNVNTNTGGAFVVYNGKTATLTNTTFTTSKHAFDAQDNANLTITSCTIIGANDTDQVMRVGTGSTITDTIVRGFIHNNTALAQATNSWWSYGELDALGTGSSGNIDGTQAGTEYVDLLLGGLADNGGPVKTMALLKGSIAIDAGSLTTGTDARGEAMYGATRDIGAYENQNDPLLPIDTSFEVSEGWALATVDTSVATATDKQPSITYAGLNIVDNTDSAVASTTLSHLIKETETGFANNGTQAVWLRGVGASMIFDPVVNEGISTISFSHKKWTSGDGDQWLRVYKKVDGVVTEITNADVVGGGRAYEEAKGFWVDTGARYPVIAVKEFGDVQFILTNNNLTASPALKGIFIDEMVINYNPATAIDREALTLDGTDDYVNVPTSSAFAKAENGGLTIEGWVKTTDTAGTIFSNYDESGTSDTGDGKGGFELAWSGSQVVYRIITDNRTDTGYEQGQQAITVDIADGEWHHVALVQGSSYLTGYVDGVQGGTWSSSIHGDLSSSDHPFRIGAQSLSSDLKKGNLAGSFSEVRIWNVARTNLELIENKYNTIDPTTPGLVGYWKLDDKADTLEDSVPAVSRAGANDGSLVGATTAGDTYLWETRIEVSNDPDYIYTPAIGIELVQTETEVVWTVAEEIGVKEYQLVDSITGELLETIVANGSGTYETTVSAGVTAKLIVVDNSGFKQTYLPSDGNIVNAVYDLQEGWNLIAMPGANADTSEIDSAFWGWNGSAYEVVEEPVTGQAVWVYSPVAKQVVISAEKVEAELTLETGWNLVGPTENMEIPTEAHTVYGWTDSYQTIANDGVLLQGVGYWIFSL